MKRKISLILTVLLLIGVFPVRSFTAERNNECTKKEDINNVISLMESRGLHKDEPVKVIILKNGEGTSKYLMGITDSSYLIMDSETCAMCECGEGNPYESAMDEPELYYCGPFEYYVKDKEKDTFYNLLLNSDVPYIKDPYIQIDKNLPQLSVNATMLQSHFITSYNNQLLRRAFGLNILNNGYMTGTCNAIAFSLALNYLHNTTSMNLVPSNMRLEYYNNGIPNTLTNLITTAYPKAHEFHRYLVEDCYMHASSSSWAVTNAISYYLSDQQIPSSYGFSVSFAWSPAYNTIISYLNSEVPVVIGTMSSTPSYPEHAVVAYGYSSYNDGSVDWYVHTGWHSNMINISGNQYKHSNTIRIGAQYSKIGYYFHFN